MGGLIMMLIILISMFILCSLPLYLCVNFVLWLFHVPFHVTFIQTFGICLLLGFIKSFFNGED